MPTLAPTGSGAAPGPLAPPSPLSLTSPELSLSAPPGLTPVVLAPAADPAALDAHVPALAAETVAAPRSKAAASAGPVSSPEAAPEEGAEAGRAAFDGGLESRSVQSPEYAALRAQAHRRVKGAEDQGSVAAVDGFARRNPYMDQFDAAARGTDLQLWPDTNFMSYAVQMTGEKTRAVLYALSGGHAFHISDAVERERRAGHVKLLARGDSERSARIDGEQRALSEMFGDRLRREAERLPEIRDVVARFFVERAVSAEDARVAADIFVSCRPGRRCAIVTFDRGFRQLRSWRNRRLPQEPTKVERDFKRLIGSFPPEVRVQIGDELPGVILLN